MAGCCGSSDEASDAAIINCPSCDTRGANVELQTVKALLVESALGRLSSVSHRFCRTPACPVVYYDELGRAYVQDEVRVRVWPSSHPALERSATASGKPKRPFSRKRGGAGRRERSSAFGTISKLGCAVAVKMAAKSVDGVKECKVSYEKGTAEVTYDASKTTPETIAKVISDKSGFKVTAPKKAAS